MVTLKSQVKKIDKVFFGLVVGLTAFGVLMVYEASTVTAFRDFDDKYFYARQQLVSSVLGLTAALIVSKIDYHRFRRLTFPLMVATVLALVLVLIPGVGIKVLGARRWLELGFIRFQPAEIAKLALVVWLASLFSEKPRFLSFVFIMVILTSLMMLEPDLGSTVVLATTGFSLFFTSGASLFPLAGLGALGLATSLSLILSSVYRRERLITFLDLGRDPLGSSYHVRQILLAIGSGGLFGLGLGASRQKYAYLPEAMTDSIFAVIAEEIGFIGSIVLIGVFLLIIYRGISIALQAPDRFGQLLAIGITCWIGIQTLVNLAAMVVLVPLTGVPLPFISYGGSSLVMVLIGVGILLNISQQRVARK